jgi:protein involved in polysaccharide export with SLBB domain
MIVIINACSTILEPVSIIIPDKASDDIIVQEEFNIIIKSLNFKNSNKANKDAYPRQLMLTGSGAKAKLLNEKNFLTSKMPEFESIQDYRIGFKDELSFTLLNEFKNDELQWPDVSDHSEYLLGVGDKLKLIHFADVESISVLLGRDTGGNIDDFDPNDNLIESAGIIGSNGKILLLGLGNIMAANRTLSDVQAEVRNILLRNGLAHSFQLEIDAFQSKKAYVTHTNNKSSVIPINNISISLKEIALMEGLSESYKNNALITLARDYKEFRITAGQLFSPNAPEIYIQDKDQIEIKTFSESYTRTNVVVGSKGNILLPEVGVINIVDKKLDEVQELVSIKLIEKGLMPKISIRIDKVYKSESVFD